MLRQRAFTEHLSLWAIYDQRDNREERKKNFTKKCHQAELREKRRKKTPIGELIGNSSIWKILAKKKKRLFELFKWFFSGMQN